jgi:hypothetical protein
MRNEAKSAILAGILSCALAGVSGCVQGGDDTGINDKTSEPAESPTLREKPTETPSALEESTESRTPSGDPTESPTPPEETTDEESTDEETTSEETTSEEDEETTSEEPAPPDDAPAFGVFGDTIGYDDGISVTVDPPSEFSPSETAAFDEAPTYVRFSITVVNDGDQALDLTLFSNTAQSGQSESSQVFDSAQGLEGSPYTSLLPGRSVSWDVGFGVEDPNDIVMQLSPTWDHEEVVFASD